MKLNELRQIIREEISEVKKSPSSMNFEDLKQAVIASYAEYGSDSAGDELNKAMDIDELVNILDGLGFNGKEAYDFIFDSIGIL
jgi:hypothetical protein